MSRLQQRVERLEQTTGDEKIRIIAAPVNDDGTYTLDGQRFTREELREYIEYEFGPGPPVIIMDS